MSDALSRLKNRQRPKVNPRSNQVAPKSADIQTQRHAESATPSHSDSASNEDTFNPRHIQTEAPELEVKRSTFRLEVGLINRLHQHCKESGISREVLIEAMFEYVEANPEAMAQAMEKAQEKHAYRQQLANRKRAQAMMDKFGQSRSSPSN